MPAPESLDVIPTSTPLDSNYDAVIVGAGIAGTTMAHALGHQGRKVLVVERDLSEPDRIVGELLQPAGMNRLNELGMGHTVDGIDAQTVTGYALLEPSESFTLAYPKNPDDGLRSLATGRSFHHGRFIQNLRQACRDAPNVTLIQGTVLELIKDPDNENKVLGVRYRTPEGTHDARGKLTIACDGCHSRFRKESTVNSKPFVASTFVGAIMKDVQLPYEGNGHVILTDPTPVLMYRIGSDEVRVLVDIPGKLPPRAELPRFMEEKVCPQLPQSTRKSFLRAIKAGDLRSMPNQAMRPQCVPNRLGFLLLGDSFNMRHPLTGGGMTVAFTDVCLMNKMLKDVEDFSDYQAIEKVKARFYSARKESTSTVNILASALYEVFSSKPGDRAGALLRKACFDYLRKGGVFAAGPVGFLSALHPSPYFLFTHFFAVAFFGVANTLAPLPTPRKVIDAVSMLSSACRIMFPLIAAEQVTVFSWLTSLLGVAPGM
eukprot:TRINITY_DN2674_c0_g1_i1.p1 TRINITY_DN2674_c0_g1~~TRINITY_DN2674_c0_g1_i1.p1  ORF type:complete len:487 (-),score=114.76 TRINITY_DN2674_c0_g1_i1:126-1586(-)